MTIRAVHILPLVVAFVASAAFAANDGNKGNKQHDGGPGGPGSGIEFIIDHAKDLALTADEKTKLTELASKLKTAIEKAREDPDVKELGRELYELKESGADEDALKPTQKRLRQAVEKKSGISRESVTQDIVKILSPTQLKKLAELRKEAGFDPNPGKTMKEEEAREKAEEGSHVAADNSKPAPKLYDDDNKK
jgi:hypothetical protein